MHTKPAFGPTELFSFIITDMAKAISERNGETRQQALTRFQAAVQMIQAFLPRDVIEAMLAGHCVMFHEVMTDSVRETLLGEPDATRRGTRSNLVALNKALSGNLDRLARYQSRPVEGRDAAEMPAEVVLVMPRPAADAPSGAGGTAAVPMPSTTTVPTQATPVAMPEAEAGTTPVLTPAVPVRTPVTDAPKTSVPTQATPAPMPQAEPRAPAAGTQAIPVPTLVPEARTAAVPAQAIAVPTPVAETRTTAARTQAAPIQTPALETPAGATPTWVASVQTPAAAARDVAAQSKPAAVAPPDAEMVVFYPTVPEAMAACQVNPEAMAALEAGDAAGFARAMGVEQPSEGFLAAAATPGSPFDREAAGPWPAGRIPGAAKA
jgi:hypothetical protein